MYPKLPPSISKKPDLKSHFKLTVQEKNIIKALGQEKTKLGFAVLLKTYQYLGFPPRQKTDIPAEIIDYIASQLNIDPHFFNDFKWKHRNWQNMLTHIRKLTGFHRFTDLDWKELTPHLFYSASIDPSFSKIMEAGIQKCREMKAELPYEGVLKRKILKARHDFLVSLYKYLSNHLSEETKQKMMECLKTKKGAGSYDWLKSSSSGFSRKSVLNDVDKLTYVRSFGVEVSLFQSVSPKVINYLWKQVSAETVSKVKRHKDYIRFSLFSVFLYIREMELTDDLVNSFLSLFNRLMNRTDQLLKKKVTNQVKQVYNKEAILRRLILAINKTPDGSIPQVIFPEVSLELIQGLAKEYEGTSSQDYNDAKVDILLQKYKSFYRSLLKPVLEALSFHTTSSTWNDLGACLDLVKKYLGTKHIYYPDQEEIPESLVKGMWEGHLVEKGRIKKHNLELCVIGQVDQLVRCKEFWVDKAGHFCNPNHDLPQDWESKKGEYFHKLRLPEKVAPFIQSIKDKMFSSLLLLNNYFSSSSYDKKAREKAKEKCQVYLYQLGGKGRGYFRVPKIQKRAERSILKEIKKKIRNRFGMVNLLDMLVEADRHVQFSQYFPPSTPKQVFNPEEVRERLLLSLFGLGTNIGLKRLCSALSSHLTDEDLRFFIRRYITPESLREAIAALSNKILELRNPEVWGNTTTCASDGKQFPSWDQNLMADSNAHYSTRGIMVYWHVEKNATCVYSQMKGCNSSETAAMLHGLLRHETHFELDTNYVDSRGQCEVAFAFCHFLGIDLLPRLKRIKYEKVYLPDKGIKNQFPNLEHVISRPIRWDLIEEQYEEMVKYIAAVKEGTASTEAILRRFLSYNESHPTYKAFIELGKALKTIFLCRYFTSETLRVEIHEGLNIVEGWNAVNSFIYYGRGMKITSNDPYKQELSVLSLHLLQNVLILCNTIMMDRVIMEDGFLQRMTAEDKRSTSPLFTRNANPYGTMILDLEKPSFLEVA
jgi:TnpA family transposase